MSPSTPLSVCHFKLSSCLYVTTDSFRYMFHASTPFVPQILERGLTGAFNLHGSYSCYEIHVVLNRGARFTVLAYSC